MAVYLCHPCGVTIIETHRVAKPKCPQCGRDVIPKSGPGSIEEAFPEKAPHDSVFELDLNNLPPSIDPVKKTDPPK